MNPIGAIILGGVHGSLAVARSLGRRGIPVAYFAPRYSPAAYSRFNTHVVTWKGVDDPQPVETLLREATTRGLEGWVLLPSDDFNVQFVAQNREQLSRHFLLQTLDWPVLEQLNDKGELYRLAARLGVSTPLIYPPAADPESLTYPVVIKPSLTKSRNALTRSKAWRCDDAASFAARQAEAQALMGPGGFVVQQLIPGGGETQFSYAALWDHGTELGHLTALRLRQYPLEFGTSPYVVTRPLPRAVGEARKLLSAVGYHGLVEVEFKHDQRDDTLKLLDVNTRIWAWLGLGEACGIDFATGAFALAQGAAQPLVAQKDGAWRRFMPSLFSVMQSLVRHGKAGPHGWRSVLGAAHGAVLARDDLLPALSEIPLKAAQLLL